MSNPKIDACLEAFAAQADDWFSDVPFVATHFNFFKEFFQRKNLESMTWDQFKKMGDNLHSANSLAIAKRNAFGRANHEIEHYRKVFVFLIYGEGSPESRMRKIVSDPEYMLKYIGDSMWSEIFGYAFPEKFTFRNSRSDVAIEVLGIAVKQGQGAKWVDSFIEYNRQLEPVRDSYKKIVGKKTPFPLNIEIDQFFSYLYETHQEKFEGKYWWLNCNPKIWDPRNRKIGSLQTYTTHNEEGNKRRVYDYFKLVQPGDLMIGYVSSPIRTVSTLFEVTKALFNDPKEGEVIEFKKVKDYEPISWEEIGSESALENCEPLKNNQGSLFALTPEEFRAIDQWGGKSPSAADPKKAEVEAPPFSIEMAKSEIFFEPRDFDAMIEALTFKKNIILQGPPGVGKTFAAERLAYALIGQKSPSQVGFVQFHPSYSYEDFVQGIRPSPGGGFRTQNGIFMDFCDRARASEKPFVVIIDEINRGNLAKIFGELLMLIESDKRSKAVRLAYSHDGAEFSIPDNLFIIGTMNTADRSLSLVDYALRRRFNFFSLKPEFHSPNFSKHLRGLGLKDSEVKRLQSRMFDLNSIISEDKKYLGSGFEIGHSYFNRKPTEKSFEEWFESILRLEIEPLLKEYWFDDLEKVVEIVARIRAA